MVGMPHAGPKRSQKVPKSPPPNPFEPVRTRLTPFNTEQTHVETQVIHMHMNERSIRDIVLAIEKSLKTPTQLKMARHNQDIDREKLPIPLSKRQRDVIEIVYDSIEKPFGVTAFASACFELGSTEGVVFRNNGITNRSLKGWLCERMGMTVRWQKSMRA